MSNISGRRDLSSGGNTISPTSGTTLNIESSTTQVTGALAVDTIHEYTVDNGVLIESVLLKDGRITGLSSPNASDEPTTKQYVDSLVSGLTIKDPVRAATTAALPNSSTISSNVIAASVNGALGTIDSISVIVGDRILVKDESDSKRNGIYSIDALGDVSNPWQMTRSVDADNTSPSDEVRGGITVLVQEGTSNQGKTYALTSPTGTAVLGTDGITWTQLNTNYTIGTGLSLATNTVSLDIPVSVAYGGTGSTSASDARTALGCGSIATQSIPSSGIVLSTGSAITSQSMPSAGYLTSNGTTIGSNAFPASGYVSSNGTTFVSNTFPTSGYVVSNGTAFTSQATIPAADTTGLAKTANNLSDLDNAGTARTNLGLGSAAQQSSTAFAQVSNNLSDLTNSTTARSNLGLGSIATQSASSVSLTGGSITNLSALSSDTLSTKAGTSVGGVLHQQLQTSGNLRYGVGLSGSESGSNTGSDYTVFRYNDAGSYLGTPMTMQRSTGYVGLGTGSPSRPLSVVNSGFMQVNFGQSDDKGGYLHSSDDSQALIVGGARYDGGWIAKATTSSQIDMVGGNINFYSNQALTPGNAFTLKSYGGLVSGQWTFTDPNNSLDVRSPVFGSAQYNGSLQPSQWSIYKHPTNNQLILHYNDAGTSRSTVLLTW